MNDDLNFQNKRHYLIWWLFSIMIIVFIYKHIIFRQYLSIVSCKIFAINLFYVIKDHQV